MAKSLCFSKHPRLRWKCKKYIIKAENKSFISIEIFYGQVPFADEITRPDHNDRVHLFNNEVYLEKISEAYLQVIYILKFIFIFYLNSNFL